MSYKRVVTKKGKSYGPYIYESYRDANGIVRKRYLGKAKKNLSIKTLVPFIAILFFVSTFLLSGYTTNPFTDFIIGSDFSPTLFEGVYGDLLTGLSVSDEGGGSDDSGDSGSEGSDSSSGDSGSDSSDSGSSDDSESDSGDSSDSESSSGNGADSSDDSNSDSSGPGNDDSESNSKESDDPKETNRESGDEETESGDEETEEATTNGESGDEETKGKETTSDTDNNEESTSSAEEEGQSNTGTGGGGGGTSSGGTETNNNQTTNETDNTQTNNETTDTNTTNQNETTETDQNETTSITGGAGGTTNGTLTNITNTTNKTLTNATNLTNATLTNATSITNITNDTKKAGDAIQYRAVIGRPVKWIKRVNTNETTQDIELPLEAENITVLTGTEIEAALEEVEEVEELIEESDREDLTQGIITGQVARETESGTGILSELLEWLRSFTISGRVILEEDLEQDITKTNDATVIDVSDIASGEEEIAVEYYTEAPQAREIQRPYGKDVSIYSTEEYNYTNILAFTIIEDGILPKGTKDIELYWDATLEDAKNHGGYETEEEPAETTDTVRVSVPFDSFDLDEDGFIDYIEWNVPHLSEQNYSVIIRITAAEHLDSDRTFISNIYSEVRELDGNWSEPILKEEYVRVTFEENLTSEKDITVYAKPYNATKGNLTLEVYHVNGTEIIETFPIIHNETYYKIFLTSMSGAHDTFDLKVVGVTNDSDGSLIFDHIIDPVNIPIIKNVTLNATTIYNTTEENLTLYFNASDADSDPVYNITDWRLNGASIAVLNMPFNTNNTTVRDFTSWENNGTLKNDAIWNDSGKIGGAYSFDGDGDYIDLGTDTTFQDLQVNMTIVGWFHEDGTQLRPSVIAQYPGTGPGQLQKLVRLDSDALTYFTTTATSFQSAAMSITHQSNAWTFFAVRVNGTHADAGVTLRINDTSEFFALSPLNDTPITNSNITIGWVESGHPDEDFGGRIDEIAVFNRSLSDNQIDTIYAAGLANHSLKTFVSQETKAGENWTVAITGSDTYNDSAIIISNALEVIANSAPIVDNLTINTTTNFNLSTENLTAHWNISDVNGDDLFNLTDWRINGTSIAVVNIPFEAEGSNATYSKDYSSHANNASVIGATWNNASSYYGAYGNYGFDGDDAINITEDTSLYGLNESFTVSIWARKDSNNVPDHDPIIGKGPQIAWGANYLFRIAVSGTAPTWGVTCGGTEGWFTGGTIALGDWYHYALSFNSTHTIAYINGSQVASSTSCSGSTLNYHQGHNIRLGFGYRSTTTEETWWNGAMDDLKIFDRALSAEQIKAIYDNRTDLIVSQETKAGENWSVALTSFDQENESTTVVSNGQLIRNDEPPVISYAFLNSTSGYNLPTDNLTLNYSSSDIEGSKDYNATDWRVGGVSIAPVNIPLNDEVSSTAYQAVRGYSSQALNATLHDTETPVWKNQTHCKIGGCFEFDGSEDRMWIVDDPSISALSEITVSAWFNADVWPTSCSSGQCYTRLLQKGDYSSGWEYIIYYDELSGNLRWTVSTDGNDPGVYAETATSGISTEAWHHVVGTWHTSDEQLELWIDGISVGTNSVSGVMQDTSTNLTLGSSSDNGGTGSDDDWDGHIDEVMVFNRRLSDQQIKKLYNYQNNPTNDPMLVADETVATNNWSALVISSDLQNSSTKLTNSIYINDIGVNTWNCSVERSFTNTSCWTRSRVPIAGDSVVLNASGIGIMNITNNTMPQGLNSFVVQGGYNGSVYFSPLFAVGNWTGNNDGTQEWNVTTDINVSNGTMFIYGDYLHQTMTGIAGNITNEGHGQIWTSLTGDVNILSDGVLEGTGLGFPTSTGPGLLAIGAACHMGYRVNTTANGVCRSKIYGNATAPTSLGTGAQNSSGGSAIKLVSTTGDIIIAGKLYFNGTSLAVAGDHLSGMTGAGGSVWLKGATINVTGAIEASGGWTNKTFAGTGGRIRLEYGTTVDAPGRLRTVGGFASQHAVTSDYGVLTFTNNTWPRDFTIGFFGLLGGNFGDGAVLNVIGNVNIANYTEVYGDYVTSTNNWNTSNEGSGIWINATGNITVDPSIIFEAGGNGFPAGEGPSPGNSTHGASHGGLGYSQTTGLYGNETAPTSLGSGGAGMGGGGAIRFSAGDQINISGLLTTRGYTPGYNDIFTSSGGSTWLEAPEIYITSTGTVDALNQFYGAAGRIALNGTNITIISGTVDASSAVAGGGTIYVNATNQFNATTSTLDSTGWTGGNVGGNQTLDGNITILSGTVVANPSANISIYYENCDLSDISAATFNPDPPTVYSNACDTVTPTLTFAYPSFFTGMATADPAFESNATSTDTTSNLSVFIDIANTTLGWWTMSDIRGGVLFDYLERQNGTIIGNPQEVAGGAIGSAMSFDGDGDEVNISFLAGGKNELTIAAWVKSNTTGKIVSTKPQNLIFFDDFSTDKGWSGYGGSGEWQRSTISEAPIICAGGSSDPSNDHSPASDGYLIGNDIGDCYNPDLSETYYLVSPALNCTNCTNTNLSFWRRLSVEGNGFDNAFLDAYNGTHWVQVFANGASAIVDSDWGYYTYNISTHADANDNLSIRFGIGSTDSANNYAGWNIDDIRIAYDNPSFGGDEVYLSTEEGGIFYIEDAESNTSIITHNSVFNDSAWHHIMGSWTASGTMRLYIDGALVNTTVAYSNNTIETNEMYIGNEFYGDIDDVVMMSRGNTSLRQATGFYSGQSTKHVGYNYSTEGFSYQRGYSQDFEGNINATPLWNFYIDRTIPTSNTFIGATPNNGASWINETLPINLSSSDTLTNISMFIDLDNKTIGWWRMEPAANFTFEQNSTSCYNDVTTEQLLEVTNASNTVKGGDKILFLNGSEAGNEYVVNSCSAGECQGSSGEGGSQCCSLADFSCPAPDNQHNTSFNHLLKVKNGTSFEDFFNKTNGTSADNPNDITVFGGRFGKALNLTLVQISLLDYSWMSSESFSMSAWIWPDHTEKRGTIIGKGGNIEYSLHIGDGNDLVFEYWNTTPGAELNITSTNAITAGQWYHVTVTYNGSMGKLYLNGASIANNSVGEGELFNDTNAATVIGIGYHNTTHLAGFNGLIDDVLILNRSLSDSEVNGLWNNGTNKQIVATYTSIGIGNHTYTGYAQDLAGNINATTRSLFVNATPNTPTIEINSSIGLNRTAENLSCIFNITDPQGDKMNVSVNWYQTAADTTPHFTHNFTGQANGTLITSTLHFANTSKTGDNSKYYCNVSLYDGLSSTYALSGNLTVVNTPPVITINNPSDKSSTTDRTPTFSWDVEDNDSADQIDYFWTATAVLDSGGESCSDSRTSLNFTENTHTPTSDFLCLYDNGFIYNWTIQAHDREEYGPLTYASVNITALISSNLTVSEVDFGSLGVGETNNTTNNNPPPFTIENDGNAYSNISINSSAFWEVVTTTSKYYQFKIANTTGEPGAFNWSGSLTNWNNVSITGAVLAIDYFNYTDTKDEAEIELNVTVPDTEYAGSKGTIIRFTSRLDE